MDDVRRSVLDLSGRGMLLFAVNFNSTKIGFFDVELINEFFRAFAVNAELTLHITSIAGSNNHHIAEATFKSVARALRQGIEMDEKISGSIPSTKGHFDLAP